MTFSGPETNRVEAGQFTLREQIRDQLISIFAGIAKLQTKEFLDKALRDSSSWQWRLVAVQINHEFRTTITSDRLAAQGLKIDQLVKVLSDEMQPKTVGRKTGNLVLPQINNSSTVAGPTQGDSKNSCNLGFDSILGPYRVIRFLGRGAFGSVFLAKDQRNGIQVAIKVPAIAGGGRYLTRLESITVWRTPKGISPDIMPAEAIVLSQADFRIGHLTAEQCRLVLKQQVARLKTCAGIAGVVEVIDEIPVGEGVAVVTQYAEGHTLREKIRSLMGIHLNWFARIAEICAAIGGHGDLKPENIIIGPNSPNQQLTLIDPAVSVDINNRKVSTVTPAYNPFLLDGERADVTAIGIMLYEIVTGTLPFTTAPRHLADVNARSGKFSKLSQSSLLSYPPPSLLNPKAPPELETVISKCLIRADYSLANLANDLLTFIKSAGKK